MQYTPKDLTVTAVQFTGSNWDAIRAVADVIKPGLGDTLSYSENTQGEIWLNVRTPHGALKAKRWDWIVLDEEQLRFFPLDHEVFMALFKEAPAAEQTGEAVGA